MSIETTERTPTPAPVTQPRRGFIALIVAVVGALALAAAVFVPGDDPMLELSLGAGDGLASCLQFDVATLAGMSVAFEGTVTDIEGERVVLEVERWYTGGDTARVALIGPAGLEALVGGIDFEDGGRYLITAAGGVVNYCGYSGAATPEFRAAFEQAFGG